MEEQIVKYKTAKIAKECGYFVWSQLRYNRKGKIEPSPFLKQKPDKNQIFAPTQSLLQRWLREKHGIHIVIIPTVTSAWTFKTVNVLSERVDEVIIGLKGIDEVPPYENVSGYDFDTYEDALEEGLENGLQMVLEN